MVMYPQYSDKQGEGLKHALKQGVRIREGSETLKLPIRPNVESIICEAYDDTDVPVLMARSKVAVKRGKPSYFTS